MLVRCAKCVQVVSLSSYLGAAVDGGVLANTVDLVAGAGVDNVVRLGSVARHVCGFGGLVVGLVVV
jgi:pentose-5-phosphate-3-epimerase